MNNEQVDHFLDTQNTLWEADINSQMMEALRNLRNRVVALEAIHPRKLKENNNNYSAPIDFPDYH